MQTAAYIIFGIHSLILFTLTGVAFMQSGDFKYFSHMNKIISYVFAFLILSIYAASLIIFLTVDFG